MMLSHVLRERDRSVDKRTPLSGGADRSCPGLSPGTIPVRLVLHINEGAVSTLS